MLAGAQVERTEAVYAKAIALDRGYAPHLAGRCRNRIRREAKHAGAEEDATLAVTLNPGLVEAWLCRGLVRAFRAQDAAMQGDGQALRRFDQAEKDFQQASALDPRSWNAFWGLALVRHHRAAWLLDRGRDAASEVVNGLRAARQGLALAADNDALHLMNGRLRALEARRRFAVGGDPRDVLAQGDSDLELTLNAFRSWGAIEARASLRAWWGWWRQSRGEDGTADFTIAEREYAQVMPEGRASYAALVGRGTLRTWFGRAALEARRDPTPIWAGAEADLTAAIQRKPGYAMAWLRRAALWYERSRNKGTPAAALAQARKDFAEGQARDATLARAFAEFERLPLP